MLVFYQQIQGYWNLLFLFSKLLIFFKFSIYSNKILKIYYLLKGYNSFPYPCPKPKIAQSKYYSKKHYIFITPFN